MKNVIHRKHKPAAAWLFLGMLILLVMTMTTNSRGISNVPVTNVPVTKSTTKVLMPCQESNYIHTQIRPNDTAVICSIVSNEEFYIDEWLDYNIGIGFTHIYIYDNTNQFDLGHNWLQRRPRLAGRVTIQHYPGQGQGKQFTAYRDCARQVLQDGHRWIFFTDVDEFLVLKKHPKVVPFLLEHDVNRTAVSINWQVHSWDDQFQFQPRPVTQRFMGKAVWDKIKMNLHVKTISNVDKIDLNRGLHAHYAALNCGNYAIDTDGKNVSERHHNADYPSNIALVYHYNAKSWKEFIAKRIRGRPDVRGNAYLQPLVEKARQGMGLENTSAIDPSAWEMLKLNNPKYRFFDNTVVVDSATVENNHKNNVSIGICCHVKDQEAYIDEWIDYHLALGFSTVYLYDSTEEFWMSQWGEERNETRLSLVHFPSDDRNTTILNERVGAYTDCVRMHGKDNDALLFLEVSDFVVFPGRNAGIEQLLDQSECVQFERILFGHGGQFIYDPLPVTKRFFLWVNETTPDFASHSLLLPTKSMNSTFNTQKKFERDLIHYLTSGQFSSNNTCPVQPITPVNIYIHHYLRSAKECNKEKGDSSSLCNIVGSVEDRTAWEQMRHLVPWYANFDDLM